MTKPVRISIVLSVVVILLACQPLEPQQASPAIASYDVGARPVAIATGDFNGDGALDVAVANSSDGTVSILIGVRGGRFRPGAGSPFPAGREPADVDAADLDRDGDIDLALANHETSRVTVLLNDKHGRFTMAPGSPFETGARPHIHSVATADFDGDGWTDVAVDSSDTKEVRVLRGSPQGFGAVVTVSLGTMPYNRLGAANVIGDDHNDVLVPGHGDSTVRAVQRGGSGLVLAAWNIRLHAIPWMVVGEDLNGDRRTDVVVVHTDAISVWMADQDGFSPAMGSPFQIRGATFATTGDLDGDGLPEVAVGPWDGDEVTVLTGQKLTARKIRTCERPIGLAIADLDGDRRGELLATCANHNRMVVVRMPAGT